MGQQFIEFPQATRTHLAALELEHERGELTDEAFAAQETQVIEEARALLKLGPEWRTDPNAPLRDYTRVPLTNRMISVVENGMRVLKPDALPERFVPTRRTLCFWKET